MTMVLFIVSMTAVTSCSKDNTNLILGKWKMAKITGSAQGVTYTISMHEFMEAYGGNGWDDFVIEFKNDGKVYAGDEAFSYSINRDKLTVFEGEDTVEMTINKLTSSKLVLGHREDDVDMAMEFQRL